MKFIVLLLSIAYSCLAIAEPSYDMFKTYHNSRFSKFKTFTRPKLEDFVNQHLKTVSSEGKAVFYPFGGPDIIYPLMLFPQAHSYILVGLEPRGNKDFNTGIPGTIHKQLDSLLRRSFFVTADMSRIIPKNQGVLPLFLAQITLMNGSVKELKFVDHSFGKSIEISFMHLNLEKKLIYIQANMVNQNLTGDFLNFIKDNNFFDICILKASSYLLHQHSFSKVRAFILANAKIVLQDDSGVPIKEFSKNFTLHLFGNYIKPYGKEWEGYFQKDLYKMYHDGTIKPNVPFCYGYGCAKSEASIILAVRG